MKQSLDLSLDQIKIKVFDVIDSTNDYLKRNYQILDNFTVIVTKYQTKGRGQFERKWISNKNENLLFSVLLKNTKIEKIEYIKEKIRESIIDTFKEYNIEAYYKAPNDIYASESKICGILIETLATNQIKYDYVIIGIGINVNQTTFDELLNATSMKLLTNKTQSKKIILKDFLRIFTTP